jgi:hypothetical protein
MTGRLLLPTLRLLDAKRKTSGYLDLRDHRGHLFFRRPRFCARMSGTALFRITDVFRLGFRQLLQQDAIRGAPAEPA